MYVDDPNAVTGADGWQVEPAQIREFAAAVEEVRADLDAIFADVAELATPAYLPMLGTSPVGQELAEKFTERLGGETGLRGQLEGALKRMEEFVASAEKSAANYAQSDDSSATRFRNGS
ncbi:hypothetical protein UO65_3464 [Actinokineospora spheciospongiae]|uniref:PE domain-containing protein n=1 Tax=Actinokineospora spheciospongiae TaxID=909613 RepID=W7ILH3_9PSEU|nr:hypothetical protein [Actinokineospora spheciospongiae]EWC61198.1 hypothetical protein UO65_3464 [Actinokineospora spheciospongiae]PWW65349.1 hypothetical protein DFQ13_10299 [Actinokineospora spheciospongiae]